MRIRHFKTLIRILIRLEKNPDPDPTLNRNEDPVKKVPDPDPAGKKSPDPTGSGSSSLDILMQPAPVFKMQRIFWLKIRFK